MMLDEDVLLSIARQAGDAIMEIYAGDFDVYEKEDDSPLTQADLAAHNIIIEELKKALIDNNLNYNVNNLLDIMDIVNRNNIINLYGEVYNEEMKDDLFENDQTLVKYFNSIKTNVNDFMKENLERKTLVSFSKAQKTIIDYFNKVAKNIIDIENKETTIDEMINLKNIIRYICFVFPNIIINKVKYDYIQIHEHWGLSEYHEKNVKGFIKADYEELQKIGNIENEDVNTSIKKAKEKMNIINNMMVSVDSYVFKHGKLPAIIWQYCFFKSLEIYITPITDNDNDIDKQPIANMINIFCVILSKKINKTLYTYDELTSHINRAKEKEKNEIVEALTNMSDDAREIENLHKESKLEKWGVGLRSDFGNYTREGYDIKEKSMNNPDSDATTDVYTDADYQNMEEDQYNDGNSDFD